MNIGLIDCSLSTYNTKERHFMPLGLLSIAAIAEQSGHNVVLLELQDWMIAQYDSQKNAIQSSSFARIIADNAFDILGFTTRCDNLPYVLEVAKQCKNQQKDVIIVLGGPGASFCDMQILNIFPDIDIIVRGEGEATFAELLTKLEKDTDLSSVKGITYRNATSSVRQNTNRKYIDNLDMLPILPFHLVDLKLQRSNYTWTNIEAGRGCPQMCRFCSTCLFWGKRSRMRPPQQIINEMKVFNEKYGYNFFTLIHDNILANRQKFLEFCDLVQQELPGVKWSISASLNLTNLTTIEKMQNCGCTQVFVGIESVSRNGTTNITNKILKPDEIQYRLNLYRQHKIKTRNSYIIGFPNELPQDINQTLKFAIETQAASTFGLLDGIQIHPLTLHPGTALYREYQDNLSFVNCGSDLTDPIFSKMENCIELIKQYPTLFTAYASYLTSDQHARIVELCNFFTLAAMIFPKSLAVALTELNLTPIEFMENFKTKTDHGFDLILRHHVPLNRLESKGLLQSFPAVLREICLEQGYSGKWIELFLDYESPRLIPLFHVRSNNSEMDQYKSVHINQFIQLIPFIPPTTAKKSFAYNIDDLFKAYLQTSIEALDTYNPTRVFYYLPRNRWEDKESISFAIEAVDALSARIFQWTNGKRTCGEIVNNVMKSLSFSTKTQLNHNVIHRFLGHMIGSGLMGLTKN